MIPLTKLNSSRVITNRYVFFKEVKGLEKEPEGGKRCFKCYELRLRKTAELAKAEDV